MRKYFLLSILIGFGTLTHSLPVQAPPAPEGPVWYWYQDCPAPKTLALVVRRRGVTLYRTTVPICQIPRTDAPSKTLWFFFKAGSAEQAEFRTALHQSIEANIWLAGSDPDGMMLGVSFTSSKRIVLNTLHLALPDRPSNTPLGAGIALRTYPLPGK